MMNGQRLIDQWRAAGAPISKTGAFMPCHPMDKSTLPPRHWALVGHSGSGKSTLAAQLAAPLLVIDADHRFAEVAHLVAGDVLSLSEEPADHVQAECIADLLKQNMAGSGIKTVIVDSLTSILSPLVVEAILDNEAGRNRNRVAAFKDKALAMRLLQDAVAGWGCDVLWIYHLRTALDGHAKQIDRATISVVELVRLRRSLNMQLHIVQDGERRGVHVDWARRGRRGLTLWDDSESWRGMPERIECAVYGGLTAEQMDALERQQPVAFSGPEAAIAWGYEQQCFRDAAHAANAYEKVKREGSPQSAAEMWALWLADVARRKQAMQHEEH